MKYTVLSVLALLALSACQVPGRRAAAGQVMAPAELTDFRVLYSENCSGCHGADGQRGVSTGMADPVYLAIADDATIRRITAEGVPGTTMPAFAQESGGFLTNAQIDSLVNGIRGWAKPAALGNQQPPPYTASQPGNPAHGQSAFNMICSSCHGLDGRGPRAIADNTYLSLVSDQHLRTVIITGMPHLGMPDWRSQPKPLTDADVTDIVAWLVSQRQPLSAQLTH
jgi:cytochrome c oxidase cbb3-type subunit III